MNGREISQAWNEWIKSEEGESCLAGTATGEYLQNRLWRAFMAGQKIGVANGPVSGNRPCVIYGCANPAIDGQFACKKHLGARLQMRFSSSGQSPQDEEGLDVVSILTNACQVFDGWHHDGTAWSEWDESVRKDLSKLLAWFINANIKRSHFKAGAASHNGQGWVFVDSGKLPQSREWVNVCVEHDGQRHVAPAFGVELANDNGRWRWECEFKVIAWQPLPAPPSEADGTQNASGRQRERRNHEP